METCRSNNSSKVWCGCNMNAIRILMAPNNLFTASIESNFGHLKLNKFAC